LITGESGTGKELTARALHQLSPRKDGPFVALNCAAIPKDLAESELFGHAKGDFTGATERRVGKFAAADRGTLLIDEIGEMELPVQAKLVRTLETHTISPVGSNDEQPVDVRVVAATHRNLRALVEAGRFREDLYYRLHVVHIDLPPLRQRRADIPLLVATFLQQFNRDHGRNVQEVSPAAMDALRGHPLAGQRPRIAERPGGGRGPVAQGRDRAGRPAPGPPGKPGQGNGLVFLLGGHAGGPGARGAPAVSAANRGQPAADSQAPGDQHAHPVA
jgi:transcriptional regulator with PAS, ATPase and Fis domain